MTKFDTKIKSKITKDWQKLFPSFGIYKPLHLLKRCGPLLVGICLERDSNDDSYLPASHVHNLCVTFPVITLTLWTPLTNVRNGSIQRISVTKHNELVNDAALRLKQVTSFPLDSALHLDQVIQAYLSYMQLNMPTSKYPIKLFEDAITLTLWCGKYEMAKTLFSKFASEVEKWDETVTQRFGGKEAWYKRIDAYFTSAAEIRSNVLGSSESLKVKGLPESDLVCDISKSGS